MGAYNCFLHFLDCDVRLALWNSKEVRIRCGKQGLNKLASEFRLFVGYCSGQRHWPDTYRACVWDSCHFLPLCHQPPCISSGILSYNLLWGFLLSFDVNVIMLIFFYAHIILNTLLKDVYLTSAWMFFLSGSGLPMHQIRFCTTCPT